jgi:hypothetical protein
MHGRNAPRVSWECANPALAVNAASATTDHRRCRAGIARGVVTA